MTREDTEDESSGDEERAVNVIAKKLNLCSAYNKPPSVTDSSCKSVECQSCPRQGTNEAEVKPEGKSKKHSGSDAGMSPAQTIPDATKTDNGNTQDRCPRQACRDEPIRRRAQD